MVDVCCAGPLKEDTKTVEGNNIVTPQVAWEHEAYPPDPLNSMLGMIFGAAAEPAFFRNAAAHFQKRLSLHWLNSAPFLLTVPLATPFLILGAEKEFK